MKIILSILLFVSCAVNAQIHIRMINGIVDTIVIPDPLPGNNAPIITSVAVTPSVIRLPLDSATLTGHSTDYDGTVTLVHWAKVIGSAVTIVSPDDSTTKVRGLMPGTYRFSYQVTDDDGDIAVRYYEFTVLPVIPPDPPVTPPDSCWNFAILDTISPTFYNNQTNLVIENKAFINASDDDLELNNCTNCIIRHCYFGYSVQAGLRVNSSSNVKIVDNLFANNKPGLIVFNSTGVKVDSNQFLNPHRVAGEFYGGNAIKFDQVYGGGNRVRGNRIEDILGEGDAEDLISMNNTNGISGDPILIEYNLIKGGGPSTTGGSIQTGDGGGSWQTSRYNTIYNAAGFGVAVSGGSNMVMDHNTVVMRNNIGVNDYLVALYVANYAGGGCGNVTVSNNIVAKNSTGYSFSNNTNPGNNCSNVVLTGNNFDTPASLSAYPVPAMILNLCSADYIRIRAEYIHVKP